MKDSIFFKINLVFIIAFVGVSIAGVSTLSHFAKEHHRNLYYKSHHIKEKYSKDIASNLHMFNDLDLKVIYGDLKDDIIKNGIRRHRQNKNFKPKSISNSIDVIVNHGYLYLYMKDFNLLLQENKNIFERFAILFLIYFGTIGILLIIYILLRKSLNPLKRLQKEIIKYGNGSLDINTATSNKDEISIVANEFHNSVMSIKSLIEARKLFLRNILHELNTPITKGKILVELIDEGSNKKLLDSIFSRLDTLIKEFANIEQITSNSYQFNICEYRVIDIIDNAKDLLYIENKIETNITTQSIKCDFKMMSLVYKNLIDNALKYGSKLKIEYTNRDIMFISKGQKLQKELAYYTKAFEKGNNIQNGFGLGLYIVYEILKKHNMSLEYKYQKGNNIFIVTLK